MVQAEPVTRTISVYGRTAPARTVEIKAETSGRVTSVGVSRGEPARAGQALLKLDLRDRQARLDQARAGVNEQQSAWEGQQALKPQGYISDTQLAETRAKLEAAKAELVRAELDLEYMTVRAPFDGTVQERSVEVGDYVRPGDPVATFVDNTRLIVTGSIAEQDAGFVRVGGNATAVLVTGQDVKGRIRYLAPVAEESTRTFTVELEIPNPEGKLPAGVTAEMRIPGGEVLAYRMAPSLLTLDASGELGIKTVDARNQVEFHRVQIAHSEANGVWVTGLPEAANIIVVGQGYVSAGQVVESVEAQPETALAAGRPAGAQQ
jgi:multidrug efflux system membrane fusion protein